MVFHQAPEQAPQQSRGIIPASNTGSNDTACISEPKLLYAQTKKVRSAHLFSV